MKTLTIIALFVSSLALAQRVQTPLWTNPGSGSFVGVNGYGSVASARFNNKFIWNFVQSPALTRDVRTDQMTGLHDTRNLVGGDYFLGAEAAMQIDSGALRLIAVASDEGFFDVRMPASTFGLAMFGNKPYAGDTLDLAYTSVIYGRFQKMGLGLHFRPSTDAAYGFVLSFINGESVFSGQLYTADFYTSPVGDTVHADVQIGAYLSDTGNVGFLKHNGAGAAIDAHLMQDFDAFNSKWRANVLLRNIGAVQWRPQTERYALDTAITFTGIGIDVGEDLQGEIAGNSLEDSLLGALNNTRSRGPINQLLPGWIQIEIVQVKERGFYAGLGYTARWQSSARAYGYALTGYQFGNGLSSEIEVGYGGFAAIQAGLNVRYSGKRVGLNARIHNMEALVAPAALGGLTAAAGIQYFFKS